MENVDGLEGHLLETRLVVADISRLQRVDSRSLLALRSDRKLEGVGVDILVEPSGNVALGEDGKSPLGIVESLQLGLSVSNLVSVLGPSFELRDVAVTWSREEVFRTSTKEQVDTLPRVPRVVAAESGEVLLNDGGVLASLTGVGADGGGSGIGNVCLGDDSNLTSGDSSEHLKDGLDLGVAIGLASGAGWSEGSVNMTMLTPTRVS